MELKEKLLQTIELSDFYSEGPLYHCLKAKLSLKGINVYVELGPEKERLAPGREQRGVFLSYKDIILNNEGKEIPPIIIREAIINGSGFTEVVTLGQLPVWSPWRSSSAFSS